MTDTIAIEIDLLFISRVTSKQIFEKVNAESKDRRGKEGAIYQEFLLIEIVSGIQKQSV